MAAIDRNKLAVLKKFIAKRRKRRRQFVKGMTLLLKRRQLMVKAILVAMLLLLTRNQVALRYRSCRRSWPLWNFGGSFFFSIFVRFSWWFGPTSWAVSNTSIRNPSPGLFIQLWGATVVADWHATNYAHIFRLLKARFTITDFGSTRRHGVLSMLQCFGFWRHFEICAWRSFFSLVRMLGLALEQK